MPDKIIEVNMHMTGGSVVENNNGTRPQILPEYPVRFSRTDVFVEIVWHYVPEDQVVLFCQRPVLTGSEPAEWRTENPGRSKGFCFFGISQICFFIAMEPVDMLITMIPRYMTRGPDLRNYIGMLFCSLTVAEENGGNIITPENLQQPPGGVGMGPVVKRNAKSLSFAPEPEYPAGIKNPGRKKRPVEPHLYLSTE